METLKRFFSCTTTVNPLTFQGTFVFDLSPYFAPGWTCEAVDAAPANFFELLDAQGNLYGYTVLGAVAGVYEITIQAANLGGTYTQFLLEFTLQSSCAEEQEIECCDDNVELRWLGREGGIKQWSFPGVREFDIKIGDANTFKNNNRQIQYSERKDVYSGKRISTGSITKEQADFLDEVKYSIQVWENVDDEWIPILVNNDSFFKYKSTEKFYDISIQYIKAEEIIVQSQ